MFRVRVRTLLRIIYTHMIMAMDIKDQLKCIVTLIPVIGLVILNAYLEGIYGYGSLWGVLILVLGVIVAWKLFVKWAT